MRNEGRAARNAQARREWPGLRVYQRVGRLAARA